MSELRKDPVLDRWVIISPELGDRPFDHVLTPPVPRGGFCPFCVGNESRTPPEVFAIRRTGSLPNRPGWHLRVVPHKFPVLRIEGDITRHASGTHVSMDGVGADEVVVESPDHDWRMHRASDEELRNVFTAYRERVLDLRQDRRFLYLMVFRNYGEAAGAMLSHPHSRSTALPITPQIVKEELAGARTHHREFGVCVFCRMIAEELHNGDLVVARNDHFVALCPYASRFPYELLLLPLRHCHDFTAFTAEELDSLVHILRDVLRRIHRVLHDPPFNLMIHTAPNTQATSNPPTYWQTIELDYHWHIEIVPRLIRLAGFEWGTGFYINPVPPETAARALREVE